MNEEELLAEAKRRYPLDTIFDSLGGYNNVRVREKDLLHWTDDRQEIKVAGEHGENKGVLYRKKGQEWALIKKSAVAQFSLY